MSEASSPGLGWGAYVLLAILCWGLYGLLLHTGQQAMGDPVNGRYKAFLLVGVAYLLTAVLAPGALLLARQADWAMPGRAVAWSLAAGIAGAVGAFGVLLAFGARGTPAVVNALVSMLVHRPAGGWGGVRWPFYLGILLAALGGFLVTLYKPATAPAAGAAVAPSAAARAR